MSLLEVKEITLQFGGLKAVDQVSFSLEKGSLGGLIGPNGAGKTTVFNSLTGVYQPQKGSITLDGRPLIGLKPYEISRLGMARTFQNIRLFRGLSVLENVLIAAQQHQTYSMVEAVIQNQRFADSEKALREQAMSLLEIFDLARKADEVSGSLPYGEQRKLEIVRALSTRPQILLLDEPAAGMNHKETHQLMELIYKIRKDFGLTVLLIEHDMKLVMGICENIVVLDHGVKIAEGPAAVIQKSAAVIEAYLGTEEEL